jgi:hypothetical protein
MFLLIGLLLFLLFGLLVSLLFLKQAHLLLRLGLSYLLGLGLTTIFMTFFLFQRFPINASSLLLTLFFLDLLLFFWVHKGVFAFVRECQIFILKRSLSIFEKTAVGFLIFLCFYAIVVSLYWPVKDWDAITLYDFRGKILADIQGQKAFMNFQLDGHYYGYPLLTSLGHAFVYILGGENALFLSGLFYICLILVFYGSLRQLVKRETAVGATVILALNFLFINHITTAYTNLPFAVYYATGTILLYFWMIGKEDGYLITAGLLMALGVWVRDYEPFWLGNFIILLIYCVLKKKIFYPLIFLGPILSTKLFWFDFRRKVVDFFASNHLDKQVLVGLGQQEINVLSSLVSSKALDPARLFRVIVFLNKAISPLFSPLLIAFVVFLILDIKAILKDERKYMIFIIFANMFILFIGTLALSLTFPDWEKIPGSIERLFMLFPFLIIFWGAITFEKNFLSNKK